MIDIHIPKEFKGKIKRSVIRKAAQATLTSLAVPPNACLSILITADQQIQELNQKYRRVDAPTDVLAFPAGYTNPEDGSVYLGDVILSYPRAAFQAEQRGHDPEQEVQLLVIHGILHLLDYDHADPAGKQEMWAAKRRILDQLDIGSQILDDR
jgi:probable rRNA maturation factor